MFIKIKIIENKKGKKSFYFSLVVPKLTLWTPILLYRIHTNQSKPFRTHRTQYF